MMMSTNWMNLSRAASATVALSVWIMGSAAACNSGSVRDAAFQAKRDMHRLCVFTTSKDAQGDAIFERLRSWLETDGQRLNVVLERVNADDPSVRWDTSYGIPGQPPTLPVVALIGLMPTSPRRPFVIDHWAPTLSDADLAALKASPARDEVKRSIADVWAVLVYSPGPNTRAQGFRASTEQNKETVLNAVEKQWETEHAPGISIARLDRTDPRERTLRSFVGLEPTGPDWVGVVFGRGTLLAPPLQGDDITEGNLNRLLTGLTVPCTCLQQSMTLGLGLPMTWEPELDVKAAAAVQSVVEYMETTVNLTPSPEPSASLMEQVPQEDRDVLTTALLPLGGAVGIALLAVAVILWRARRRRAMPSEAASYRPAADVEEQ
jgi:hypothetical protein